MASVKVAVRVRPQAPREEAADEAVVVHVTQEGRVLEVTNLKVPEFAEYDSRERTRNFTFDACYDCHTPQDALFHEVGRRVLDALAAGYNTCVIAYGQSGSGKTFTMMGRQGQPGLTPRICEELFSRLSNSATSQSPPCLVATQPSQKFRAAVCFLEIHNERVRDLLATPGAQHVPSPPLRVREHPRRGPYVQGLSEHEVEDASSLMSLLGEGNSRRCTARTGEHALSSRSHAVFTISCSSGQQGGCRAHLVDLAGSERAQPGRSRERREEGANINKSLVTLGNVISALADRPRCSHVVATPLRRCGHGHVYVPYRDSVLTWLLRDSLGGNAKTYMIATVSPSSGSYSETVNTLRYAQRAKRIVNQPVVNVSLPEEGNAHTIRELRAEVTRLRSVLAELQGNGSIKQRGPGEDRGESLASRWIARWQTSQQMQQHARPAPRKVAAATSRSSTAAVASYRGSRPTQMGQRASCPVPDVAPGLIPRSRSHSLPDEANEATEQPSTLMPVSEDQGNSETTDPLKRSFSSCELVYRRPTRGLSRTHRRYGSQESLPQNPDQPLSPGGSENSIASSSSSVESQRSLDSRLHRMVTGTSNGYKKKCIKSGIPVRIPASQSSSDSEKRASNSSSSAPELGAKSTAKQKNKADIVAAVTQRLYPKKKILTDSACGPGDDIHSEGKEEIKNPDTCSRATSRLRDLSRRLLANKNKQTEVETQTDKEKNTKEAACGTEKIPEPIHAFITSEVFLPMCLHQCSFIPDIEGACGNVQPDLLASRTCHESPCSGGSPASRRSPSPSVSIELPACFGMDHCEDECFSDDSLDEKRDVETDSLDDHLDKPCLWKVVHLSSGQDFLGSDTSIHISNNTAVIRNDNKIKLNRKHNDTKNMQTKIDNLKESKESVIIQGEMPAEENWEVSVLFGGDKDVENASVNFKISNERLSSDETKERTLFNGLPVSSEESEPSSRPVSSDDNNSCPSPVSSDAASSGSDSSSGDDFVYYLQAPEEGGPSARCLYTIAENSEHSDHSESMETSSLSPPLHVTVSRPVNTPEPAVKPKDYAPVLEISNSKNVPLNNEQKNLENSTKPQSNFSIENIFSKYSNSPPHSTTSISFPLNITAPSNYSPASSTDSLQNSIQNKNFYPEFTRSLTPPVSSSRAVLSSSPRAQTVLTSSLLGSPPLSSVSARDIVIKHPLANVYVPLNSPKLVSRSPSPSLPAENKSQGSLTNEDTDQITKSPNLIYTLINSENATNNFSLNNNNTQEQNLFHTQNLNCKYSPLHLKSRSPSPNLIDLKTPPPPPDLQRQEYNYSQPDLTLNQSPSKTGNFNFNHSNSYDSPPTINATMSSKCFDQQFVLPQHNSETQSSQRTFPSLAANNWTPPSAPLQTRTPTDSSPQLNSWFASTQNRVRPPAPLGSVFAREQHDTWVPSTSTKASTPRAAGPTSLPMQQVTPETIFKEFRLAEAAPRRFSRDKTSSSPEPSPPAVQWADPRQRKFLNVSVVAPTRALPASVGLQGEGTSTASEDSITFVYVGPARRHAPPVLLELVRRSVGGRGLQRSVSLDSATRALARLSQRRRGEVVRACSMDTLLPEETHAFLEPARRERGPQRSDSPERQVRTSPRRDYYSGTPSDSEVRSTDDDFDDSPPPELPRVTGQVIPGEKNLPWAEMKGMILGQQPRPQTSPSPPPPPRQRSVGKKAVSWSDVSGCGLISSPSTHSLPSPTSLTGSPKPIIKKSTLAPVPQSPIPSPTPRSPRNESPVPEHTSRRERLHLDLYGPSLWPKPTEQSNRLSPDSRYHRPDPNRLSPDPPYFRPRTEPIWQRERSMSAPSSPYRDHPWYTRLIEERRSSSGDWPRDQRGPSVSDPSTPLSGSPANYPRISRSRSPPRCGSPRCHSLGDVSEVGRDAESLKAFLAQATTLLHSLSDLSRYLEQQPSPPPPSQIVSERAVQTEDNSSPHICCSHSRSYEPRRYDPNRPRYYRTEPMNINRPEPINIHRPEHQVSCCYVPDLPHCSTHNCCSNHVCSPSERSPRNRYEPSTLERQLEASCARLETSLQQPPEWQSLCEDIDLRPRGRQTRPFSGPSIDRAYHVPSSRPSYSMSQPLARAAWHQSPSLPPLPSRSVRPHFSPRAYMRHLLGVRRRIIQAARQDQMLNPEDEI